jgi:ribonuclease P/MRP protein subunit POP5
VRVAREQHRLARAALALVTRLPRPWRTPCVVRVVRVSGTIRKAEEAAIEHATRAMRRAKSAVEGRSEVGDLGGLVGLAGESGMGVERDSGGEDEDEGDGDNTSSGSEMDTD